MPRSPELTSLQSWIIETVDALIAVARDMSAAELNWMPPAEDTNSVFVLATHVMGNIEQGVLSHVCGLEPSTRDRDAEFVATGDSADLLEERWRSLRQRLHDALDELDPDVLESPRRHPVLGDVRARDLLINMINHAAQHRAHAELTRDLMRSMGTASTARG